MIERAIKELDVVVITRDVPEHDLICGDVGTVVHCYADGEAYEVEVVATNGCTVAVITLDASDVRHSRGWEIAHMREHTPVYGTDAVGGYYPASQKRKVHSD